MKTSSLCFKILTVLVSLVTLTLFFFGFASIVTSEGTYTLTGFQVAFGSTQTYAGTQINTYKGAWYAFAFILTALSVVFSAFFFKKKGSGYASVGFSAAAMINMIVLYCSSTGKFLDWRPFDDVVSLNKESCFTIALIASIATFVISVVSLLVTDYVMVKESNGAKLTIPHRIANFFKDYKSEIKKVVWPSRNTVVKNTAVVLVMCAIVGIYIAVLDFGLANLIGLILGVDLY
jgi:preprotein translocase subunit SecE